MRRHFAILVGVLVLGGLFFAQRSFRAPGTPPVVVPTGARAGDLVVVPGELQIRGVTFRTDEGTLVVQENRAAAGSRLIALPLKRIRSADPRPLEPIF